MSSNNLSDIYNLMKRLLNWLIYDAAEEMLLLYERFQENFKVGAFDLKTIFKIRMLVSFFVSYLVSPIIFYPFVTSGSLVTTAYMLIILYVEMRLLMKRVRFSGWLIISGVVGMNLFTHCFLAKQSKLVGLSSLPIFGAAFFTKGRLSFFPMIWITLLGGLYRQRIFVTGVADQSVLADLTSELLTSSLAICIFCELKLVELGKDVENLKAKQKKLAQVNEDLKEANSRAEGYSQKLKMTVKELKTSNRSLTRVLESKRIFFAKISDELRNPINSIVGNLDLIEDEVSDPATREKILSMKWSADLLLQMTNNLIDMAKLADGQMEINKRRTSVPVMLERLWAMNFYKLKQKGLKGMLSLDKRVPKYLIVDEEKLLEVCHNLITNSVKYTNQGHIKIFVTWHSLENGDEECDGSSFCSLQRFSETTHATVFTKEHFQKLKIEDNLGEDDEESPSKLSSVVQKNEGLPINMSCDDKEMPKNGITINLLPESSFNWKTDSFLLDNYQSRFSSKVDLENEYSLQYPQKGTLKIEIIDTGAGIDSTLLGLLQKAIFHKDVEVTKRIGGKGLGLYLACELTKLMDGEVYYYSKPGLGTSIIVKIPCESVSDMSNSISNIGATAATISALKHQTLMEIEPMKVALIVDDEKINRQILESFFKKFNIICIQAENGLQAVEIFKSKPPGYFLFATVDIQMPVMDGKECCAQIRAFEEAEKREWTLPIAIVTGNCFEQDKREIMSPNLSCRANYFYRKPLKMSDCENLVRDILGKNFSYAKSEPLIRHKSFL